MTPLSPIVRRKTGDNVDNYVLPQGLYDALAIFRAADAEPLRKSEDIESDIACYTLNRCSSPLPPNVPEATRISDLLVLQKFRAIPKLRSTLRRPAPSSSPPVNAKRGRLMRVLQKFFQCIFPPPPYVREVDTVVEEEQQQLPALSSRSDVISSMGKSPDDVEPPAIDDFGNDYALQHNPPCHAPTLFRIDEEEEDAELCTQLDEGAQDLGSTLEYDTTYHFPISEKSEDDDDERDISDAATARDGSEEEEDDEDEDDEIVRNGGAGIPIGPNGIPQPLLPPITPEHAGRKCLVLDLDETLVHTTFETTAMTEFIMPVCVDGKWANACVNKRPGVDAFLQKMGEIYEVVVFTASISQYADPVINKLDVHHAISPRLYRESCYPYKGNYIKDLSRLGRPMSSVIIVDNIALSYYFQPNNGIPVNTWTNDPTDTELETLSVFLTDLATVPDVRGVLDRSLGPR